MAFLLTVACGDSQDPNLRVIHYDGELASDLLGQVGPPTHERPVDTTNELDPCGSGGEAVRRLTYDVPSGGLDKGIRDLLGLAPSLSFEVCVDGSGRITQVWFSELH